MSTNLTARPMTEKQHELLDRIADATPEARVVGWVSDDKVGRGPIVEQPDGDRRLANFTGRLKKL